jgi:hypothetical protein
MHKYISTLVLAFTLSVGGVRAAHAGEAEKKLAIELTHLAFPKDNYGTMLEQMTTNMMASMKQSGAPVGPGDAQKVKAAVTEVLPYDELAQWNAEIYATKFTADELKELIKFYGTPVGKKAARLLPEISGEVGKKIGPLMVQRLPAALKKQGLQ